MKSMKLYEKIKMNKVEMLTQIILILIIGVINEALLEMTDRRFLVKFIICLKSTGQKII